MSDKNKLRVAMVEPIGGHSGNDFYDFGLCKAVADQGTELSFYTCDETDLDTKFNFPFRTRKPFKNIYGKDHKLIRGIRYAIGAWKAAQDAGRAGAKVVHFHVYHFAGREYLNFFLFRRKGFKVVATIHDIESFDKYGQEIDPGKYGKFRRAIDQIIVHSDYAKASLKKYFPDFPEAAIHIVPHGDSDFLYNTPISREDARKKLNLPMDQQLVLFFGQIKKVKGLDVLLKAHAIVRDQMPDVKLLVVGKPWKVEQEEFDAIVKEKNLEKDCILNYSYVPNEIIPYYFAAADVVTLPYREIYSSGVMIRSLDYSAAIVASDLDTFKKIIVEGENGVMFKNENEQDLAEKIMALLKDEAKMKRLRVNAKKTADEKFSWQLIGKKVNEIYKLALNGSSN
ncbi:MAG: glycosyltransferase family 4 protein [Chitinophagales bacterium]|nr:glycosyltransferase family 4 protein [Chitinophagales bacterium]